jgi:hypothetical protein
MPTDQMKVTGLALGSLLTLASPVTVSGFCDGQLIACLDSGGDPYTCCVAYCVCRGNPWILCAAWGCNGPGGGGS